MLREGKPYRALGLGCVLLAAVVPIVVASCGLGSVRVVDSSLTDGADGVPITIPLRFTFSEVMDPSSAEASFRIEPHVDGDFSWQGEDLILRPRTALTPGTAYTVTLEAGALSQGGRSLAEAYTWRFRTREPEVLYLGRTQPGAALRQLYTASLEGGAPRQLTEHPWGVWDYAVHPQGEGIIYSLLREDGGSDLWRMERDGTDQRLLLGCPEAACLNPAWSPDGRLVAYERRDLWADGPNLDPKAGCIWLLDLEEGEERPLFDYDVPLHSPVWAPQGERLAYASPLLPGLEVYQPATEALQQFGNEWGAVPVWSPDGDHLVVPELMLAGEELVVRLVRIDLEGEEMVDISGDDDFVKDASPAWSPGGGWIAFGRQFLDAERWTPGRQLWLTRPDASEAYPLLVEPTGDLFAFAWRPDGAALAYLRSDLSEGPQPVPDVSVWVYDMVGREPLKVADDGVLPGWLP